MTPLSRQFNGKQYYYYAHYYKQLQAHNMRDKIKSFGYRTRLSYGSGKWTLWIEPMKEIALCQSQSE